MDELAAYEGRLRRAGLPLLIEDYSAYEDIFTRAVPLLALVFGVQLVGAANLDWPVWANALSLAGGLAVLLGSLAVVNRRRGRRAMSVPDRVGPAELAGFVFIPALLPLISGGQIVSAIVTAGGNALLLALIYARRRDRPAVDPRLGRAARRRPALGVARAPDPRGPGAPDLHDRPVHQHRDVAGLLGRRRRGARRGHRAVLRAGIGLHRLAPAQRGARARARRRRRAGPAHAPALQRRARDVRQPGAAGARRLAARRPVLRRVRRAGGDAARRRGLAWRAAARRLRVSCG